MRDVGWDFRCMLKSRWNAHSIVAEPGDVSFVAGVEENRSSWLLPVFVSNEVSLLEGAILQESKVINLLCETNGTER